MHIKTFLLFCCFFAVNIFAFEINQEYDGTIYKSSQPFAVNLWNIKHRHSDDPNELDGAGVVLVYTTSDNGEKYVIASKRKNPDSGVDEFEVGIGGSFKSLKSLSVVDALNGFLDYKSQNVLGNLKASDIDIKAIALFGKGDGWQMNRVTYVARKTVSSLEELRSLIRKANEMNNSLNESDFRFKIRFGIFALEDVTNSADLTYNSDDKKLHRAEQVKELEVTDRLTQEKIKPFIVFDDRALALIKHHYSP